MPKSKSPFFSMGSSGSIGNSITTQKLGSSTLLREKPTPAYRFSLTQAYQRWLYQDYAYLWRQQTVATQAEYRSAGVPYHLTGFQYWMKYNLANLPDYLAWWKLDAQISGRYLDYSPFGRPLTIYGASSVPGKIDKAAAFDGVNDYLSDLSATTVNIGSEFTIALYLYLNSVASRQGIINEYTSSANRDWTLRLDPPNLALHLFTNPNVILSLNYNGFTALECHSVVITRIGTLTSLYTNSVLRASGNSIAPSFSNLRLECGDWQKLAGRFLNGWLDDIRILNRAFSTDLVEIKRHAERRHPL